MSPSQSSLLTAGMICAATASVIAGIAFRDRVDIGGAMPRGDKVVGSALLASRTNETDIPESKYFAELSLLLKQRYVDPINDDLKLAIGAVRGMVGSLNDVHCLFFKPELAKAYSSALQGDYIGIGADLILSRDSVNAKPSAEVDPETGMPDPFGPSQLPRVIVAGVLPGGPADKAGVKPGDWVYSVDGHWVYNAAELNKLRSTERQVNSGKLPASRLQDLRVELRSKAENAILPFRAFERLLQREEGRTVIVWNRPGVGRVTTDIELGKTHVDPVAKSADGALSVRLVKGVGKALSGAMPDGPVTLDLRSRFYGDFEALKEALAAVGPSGSYGKIVREGDKPSLDLKVSGGRSDRKKLTILVDTQTGGLYHAFAQALAAKAGAIIVGPREKSPIVSTLYNLPDGSAFTLALGTYQAGGTK